MYSHLAKLIKALRVRERTREYGSVCLFSFCDKISIVFLFIIFVSGLCFSLSSHVLKFRGSHVLLEFLKSTSY
jgi:hypothetical protein